MSIIVSESFRRDFAGFPFNGNKEHTEFQLVIRDLRTEQPGVRELTCTPGIFFTALQDCLHLLLFQGRTLA